MKDAIGLKEEFKNYLLKKGYDPISVGYNEYGLNALVEGYPVQLKDFSGAYREEDNSIVRLSKVDFYNFAITQGVFQP